MNNVTMNVGGQQQSRTSSCALINDYRQIPYMVNPGNHEAACAE